MRVRFLTPPILRPLWRADRTPKSGVRLIANFYWNTYLLIYRFANPKINKKALERLASADGAVSKTK